MAQIHRVAIVGCGTMGRRIAFSCALAGFETRIYDVFPRALEALPRALGQLLEEWQGHGNVPPAAASQALGGIRATPSLAECVEGADLVVETVPENIELKRQVFAEVGRVAAGHALIATNTSSIPGSWLADASGRPERVFNFNFGLVDCVKVEVMPNPQTTPETFEAALAFVRELGLVPIPVHKEQIGYSGNRVWRVIKKEVLRQLDAGIATPEDIDRNWMLEWGASIGPCGLMDRIGLDVVRDIELVYYGASQDPTDRPPPLLEAMVSKGELGEKAGRGFYTYPNPAYLRPGWLMAAAAPVAATVA